MVDKATNRSARSERTPVPGTRLNWSSAADFFAMGGYGLYVWGAYGVTLACMLFDPIAASRRHRRALAAADADGPPTR